MFITVVSRLYQPRDLHSAPCIRLLLSTSRYPQYTYRLVSAQLSLSTCDYPVVANEFSFSTFLGTTCRATVCTRYSRNADIHVGPIGQTTSLTKGRDHNCPSDIKQYGLYLYRPTLHNGLVQGFCMHSFRPHHCTSDSRTVDKYAGPVGQASTKGTELHCPFKIYKAPPITTLTLPHGMSYNGYFTYAGKLTQTIACSYPFHCQNYTAGPLTPKHTVLHLIRLDTIYTAKQYCYLRELRLILYRLSNRTYSHSLSYPYSYTRNITVKSNIYNHTMQYKSAGHTTAMHYSHIRGLTAYSYTIQC